MRFFNQWRKSRTEPLRWVPEHYSGKQREIAEMVLHLACEHERVAGVYPHTLALPRDATSLEVMTAEEMGFGLW